MKGYDAMPATLPDYQTEAQLVEAIREALTLSGYIVIRLNQRRADLAGGDVVYQTGGGEVSLFRFKRDIELIREPGKKIWHILGVHIEVYPGEADDGTDWIEAAEAKCEHWISSKPNKSIARKTLKTGETENVCTFCVKGREHPLHRYSRDW